MFGAKAEPTKRLMENASSKVVFRLSHEDNLRAMAQWLPLTNAVELVRPLFMDQWPAHALRHALVLTVYAVGGFWIALALTRKRFRG